MTSWRRCPTHGKQIKLLHVGEAQAYRICPRCLFQMLTRTRTPMSRELADAAEEALRELEEDYVC